MINGNSVVLQLGEETTYGTVVTPDAQVKISSESYKPAYNKAEEGLATGGRGSGKVQTMGISVDGGFSTLLRPDMGNILKWLCGVSASPVAEGDGYKHVFTAIGTGLNDSLPSFSTVIDRKAGVFAYTGCKVNSASFSAASGDYVKLDVTVNAKNEATGTLNTSATPSSLKAFRFAGGKVKINNTSVADVTNIKLDYNNNLSTGVQTTETGNYYLEPECGTRQITASLELIYSASAETIRSQLYKTDDTFALVLEFTSDEEIATGENYKLTVAMPCCQCSDADANMGGLDTLSQNMTVNVVDNLSDELITFTLINDDSTQY